jgi:hypothetical protein
VIAEHGGWLRHLHAFLNMVSTCAYYILMYIKETGPTRRLHTPSTAATATRAPIFTAC